MDIKIVVVHSERQNEINSNIYHSRSDFTEKIKGCSLSVSQHDKKKLHTLFYWILHIEWWILHMALGNSLLKHHFIISKKNIWETSCCKLYIYIFHKYSHLFLDLSATCIFYSSEIGSCIQYIYWFPEFSMLRHDSVAIVWLLRAREQITHEFGKAGIGNPPSYHSFQTTYVGFKSLNIQNYNTQCHKNKTVCLTLVWCFMSDRPEGREAGASWGILSLQPIIWGQCAQWCVRH